MNKKHETNGGDRQSMASLKRSKYFEQLETMQREGRAYTVGNMAGFLYRTKIEGMLTIRFEKGNLYEYELEDGHEPLNVCPLQQILWFIPYLAKACGCGEEGLHWIGTKDVEEDGIVNVHILFNFFPWEINDRKVPSVKGFQRTADNALDMFCTQLEFNRDLIHIYWMEAYDEEGLIDFFERRIPGKYRKHKYSSHPKRWLTNEMMESNYEDLSPREKLIMDLYQKKAD